MIRTGGELVLGLLIAGLFLSSVAGDCNVCNINKECCRNINNISECDNGFKSWVNSSEDQINEGDSVTLECSHNIPALNLSYTWFKDDEESKEHDKTILKKKVLSNENGKYKCCVKTSCGECGSPPFDFQVQSNGVVIIVVCGVAALALILVMGVAMKIKLKKDNAQHKERMRQRRQEREQDAQNAGPIPIPRTY